MKVKDKNPNKIFSKSTKDLIAKRSELIKIKHKTKDKEELSKIFKQTNKAIKKDYCNYRNNVIAENLNRYRSTKRPMKELIPHRNWIHNLKTDNKTINTRQDIISNATEFYKELYAKDTEYLEVENSYALIRDHEEEVDPTPISSTEVKNVAKRLKCDKNPGPDYIANEALKIGMNL